MHEVHDVMNSNFVVQIVFLTEGDILEITHSFCSFGNQSIDVLVLIKSARAEIKDIQFFHLVELEGSNLTSCDTISREEVAQRRFILIASLCK